MTRYKLTCTYNMLFLYHLYRYSMTAFQNIARSFWFWHGLRTRLLNLKLSWSYINAPPFLKIKFFLSMLLLLKMVVMLDFIFTGFARLSGTDREQKIQMKICLQRDSNEPDSLQSLLQRPRPFGYTNWDV